MPVMVMGDVNAESSLIQTQKNRCKLREQYLRVVANLVGKQCNFLMHNGQTVTGVYRGADIEFHNILVDNLNGTNVNTKNAILRSSDILSMTFEELSSVS